MLVLRLLCARRRRRAMAGGEKGDGREQRELSTEEFPPGPPGHSPPPPPPPTAKISSGIRGGRYTTERPCARAYLFIYASAVYRSVLFGGDPYFFRFFVFPRQI